MIKRVTIKVKSWSITFPMKGNNREIKKQIIESVGRCDITIEPETRKWLMEVSK